MSIYLGISKEDHPEWPNRILDPTTIRPGMKVRRIHCLVKRLDDEKLPIKDAYMDYILEVTGVAANGLFSAYRKDMTFFTDAGVVPYGSDNEYNSSNFLVLASGVPLK